MTICDADAVDLTNLQRQILYATADIGERKVDAAAQRLAAVNPDVADRAIADARGRRAVGRRSSRPPTSCSTAATTSRRGTR